MNSYSLSFETVKEFNRDLKKLKKYRNLKNDLNTFLDLIKGLWPTLPRGTVPISNLGSNVTIQIYKARHFYSKDIGKGSRSGFRVIFAFIEDELGIVLIEIYHKSDKRIENRERIHKYFGK